MATKPLPVHGADISHYQSGPLDLAGAHKRGLRFLYHKATEGTTYVDPFFARRRLEAERAALPFGGYHFARPKIGNATAEALHFLSVVQPRPGDMRPVLDLEDQGTLTNPEIDLWAKTFVSVVESKIGVKPIIYGPFDLGAAVRGCLLWRPRYSNTNMQPRLHWDIWQFSDGTYGVPRSVNGLGRVDLNTMRKGLKFADMRMPSVVVPKPTGSKVPSFKTPSPVKRPKQAHALRENDGDTLTFQTKHAGEAGDQNIWAFFTVPRRPATGIHFLLGHSSTMGKDGFTYIVDAKTGRLRLMTHAELIRHKYDWSYADVMRCRKPNGQHPITLSSALRHAKAVGFHMIPEPKDPRFALPEVARTFVAVFRQFDTACWPKYLANFPKVREVVQAFGEAGVTCSIIGGRKAQAEKKKMATVAKQQSWKYQPHIW